MAQYLGIIKLSTGDPLMAYWNATAIKFTSMASWRMVSGVFILNMVAIMQRTTMMLVLLHTTGDVAYCETVPFRPNQSFRHQDAQ